MAQKCLAKGIPVEAMDTLLGCCSNMTNAVTLVHEAKRNCVNPVWADKLEMLEGILRAQNVFLAKLLEE